MIPLKSTITKKILNYFFINPHESLYVNELSRKLALDKRNLVKKIKELEDEGILTHEARGNLKLYSINSRYPLYREFRKIIMSTIGLEDQLRRLFQDIDGIKEAYIYGSYAKDAMEAHSDIDLLIIGSVNTVFLQKRVSVIQKDLNREFNITVMDDKEYRKRIKNEDPFISGVIKEKRVKII